MRPLSSKPLITTVIPTYCRPQLLRQAIFSVLNQTYPLFQVCVYDNASGDETFDLVAEIARKDSRVKYYCHSKNIGGVANFNYGMKQIATPYFSLLSDDNTLLPHFFEDAINSLNSYPEAIFFAGQTINLDEKGRKYKGSLDLWEPGLIFPPDGLLNIIEKGLPTWESVLFRSEVLNSVELLNPVFGGSADQDFMMRIAKNHIFYVLKKEHALFPHDANSWSNSSDLREVIGARREMLEFWCKDPDLSDIMKDRIMKTLNGYVEREISEHVFRKSIIGEEHSIIAVAIELMKKEACWSFRPIRMVIMAKLASYNRFLKGLVISSFNLYSKLKIKYISLKNRKNA